MPNNTAKNAILKAKIEGSIYEILVKTTAANVMVDDTTTLAAKLASIATDCALKATKTELTDGLAKKAEKSHKHEQSDINGLGDALSSRPTTTAMNTAISTAISNLIDDAPEAYDTLKEIAQYIASDKTAMDALNSAIGSKADKTAFEAVKATVDALGALASKSKVEETDLADELKEKVNAAAEGNHSHANKALLDTYDQTNVNIKDAVVKKHSHANKALLDTYDQTNVNIKDAVDKKHSHANKTVLDGIDADDVTAWNKKGNIYYSATEPAALTENDLWFQIVE